MGLQRDLLRHGEKASKGYYWKCYNCQLVTIEPKEPPRLGPEWVCWYCELVENIVKREKEKEKEKKG